MPDGTKWNPRFGDVGEDSYIWPQDMPIAIGDDYSYLTVFPSQVYIDSISGLNQIAARYNLLNLRANLQVPIFNFSRSLMRSFTDGRVYKDQDPSTSKDWVNWIKKQISSIYFYRGLPPISWTYSPYSVTPVVDRRQMMVDIFEIRKALDVTISGRLLVSETPGSDKRGRYTREAGEWPGGPFYSWDDIWSCAIVCPGDCPPPMRTWFQGECYPGFLSGNVAIYREAGAVKLLSYSYMVHNFMLKFPAYYPPSSVVSSANFLIEPSGGAGSFSLFGSTSFNLGVAQKFDPARVPPPLICTSSTDPLACPPTVFVDPPVLLGSGIYNLGDSVLRIAIPFNLIDPNTPGTRPPVLMLGHYNVVTGTIIPMTTANYFSYYDGGALYIELLGF